MCRSRCPTRARTVTSPARRNPARAASVASRKLHFTAGGAIVAQENGVGRGWIGPGHRARADEEIDVAIAVEVRSHDAGPECRKSGRLPAGASTKAAGHSLRCY